MDHQQQQQELEQQYPQEHMVLYEHELRWAHQIKEAIAANESLRPISDFEVVQFAICTCADPFGPDPERTTNLAEILERVYRLQCFQDQYKLDTKDNPFTVEEGCQLLRAYLKQQQPGHLVTVDYLPTQDHYMIVWDRAAFHPSKVVSESDWKIYQGATYSIFLALGSHFRAIRSGVEVILECDGMGRKNYDGAFEERRVNELFNYYPFINKDFHFLNTPTVAVMMYQVVKPFLSKDFKQAVKLDAILDGFEGQRINTLYNVPTFEYAQDRLLCRMEKYLRERLHHQRTYQLSAIPEPDNTRAHVHGLQRADSGLLADESDDDGSQSDMSLDADF